MVLEVYRSSFLSRPHERVQMDLLMRYLKAKFDTKDERCVAVIGAKIPVTLHGESIHYEFDVIVFKDNKIIAVDLKNITGRIHANCFPGSRWEADSGAGYTQVPGKNPFEQARYHRIDLCGYLGKRLLATRANGGDRHEGGDFWEIPRYLGEHVSAWVVTAEGSKPKPDGLSYVDARWFKVLPLEEVTHNLEFEREGRLLTNEQFQEFLSLTDAIQVPWDEWHRGLELEQSEDRQPKIMAVSSLLATGSHESVLEALSHIRRLNLRQNVMEVKECFHNTKLADVRIESLKILVEWEVEDLGSLLAESLTDPSPEIVSFALEYLCKVGVPEAFAALSNVLRNGPADYSAAAITAITLTGHANACDSVLGFAKSRFGPDGFRILKDWSEALHSSKEITREEYYSGKRVMFIDLETQLRSYLGLFRVTSEALGSLRCVAAASWPEDFLTSPRRVGLNRDSFPDYGEDHVTTCLSIFESALDGLGRMGDRRIVPLLLERLTSMNEDYQESIIWALGNLGDPAAYKALVERLDKGPERHRDAVVHALGGIGGDDAFNAIAKYYVAQPIGQSGYWAGKELVRISPARTEALLLKEIASNTNEEFRREFLRSLLPVASPKSVDLMVSLMRDPLHSQWASNILGKLSSDRKVFRRIMVLTRSKNPLEQASAIYALGDYYLDHLDELKEFEGKGNPEEVRLAVAELYDAAKVTGRLHENPDDVHS